MRLLASLRWAAATVCLLRLFPPVVLEAAHEPSGGGSASAVVAPGADARASRALQSGTECVRHVDVIVALDASDGANVSTSAASPLKAAAAAAAQWASTLPLGNPQPGIPSARVGTMQCGAPATYLRDWNAGRAAHRAPPLLVRLSSALAWRGRRQQMYFPPEGGHWRWYGLPTLHTDSRNVTQELDWHVGEAVGGESGAWACVTAASRVFETQHRDAARLVVYVVNTAEPPDATADAADLASAVTALRDVGARLLSIDSAGRQQPAPDLAPADEDPRTVLYSDWGGFSELAAESIIPPPRDGCVPPEPPVEDVLETEAPKPAATAVPAAPATAAPAGAPATAAPAGEEPTAAPSTTPTVSNRALPLPASESRTTADTVLTVAHVLPLGLSAAFVAWLCSGGAERERPGQWCAWLHWCTAASSLAVAVMAVAVADGRWAPFAAAAADVLLGGYDLAAGVLLRRAAEGGDGDTIKRSAPVPSQPAQPPAAALPEPPAASPPPEPARTGGWRATYAPRAGVDAGVVVRAKEERTEAVELGQVRAEVVAGQTAADTGDTFGAADVDGNLVAPSAFTVARRSKPPS